MAKKINNNININIDKNTYGNKKGILNNKNNISIMEKSKAYMENNIIDINNTNNSNYNIFALPQIINRTKTYSIKYIKKWNERNKIPLIEGIDNIDFQSNMIIDQIKILLDNMSFFKIHYLQGKDVKNKLR